MTWYVLNPANSALNVASSKRAAQSFGNGLLTFSSAEELEAEAVNQQLTSGHLDDMYNTLTGESKGRAQNKSASCARLFKAVAAKAPPSDEPEKGNGAADSTVDDALSKLMKSGKAKIEAAEAAPPPKKSLKGATPKVAKTVEEPTKLETAFDVRPGTKPAMLLALLARNGTMTLQAIVKELYGSKSEVLPRARPIRDMLTMFEEASAAKGWTGPKIIRIGKGMKISAQYINR